MKPEGKRLSRLFDVRRSVLRGEMQGRIGARQRSHWGNREAFGRGTGQALMGRDETNCKSARTHMHACAALYLQLGLSLSSAGVVEIVWFRTVAGCSWTEWLNIGLIPQAAGHMRCGKV